MKKTLMSVFLIVSILSAFCAFAKEGAEGHGGEVIDIDKRPRLRDLVDNTTCVWVKATDFAKRTPRFEKVLESIDRVHWYLAYVIREEVPELSVCAVKGQLKQIPDDETFGVTVYEKDSRQVAIRLNDMIFIDETIFKQLNEQDRAYLLLHEVIHSFVPSSVKRRPQKVRSFVRSVFENEHQPMTPEQFGLQITKNELAIGASTVGALTEYKQNILTVLSENASRKEREEASAQASLACGDLLPAHCEFIDVYLKPLKIKLADAVKRRELTTVQYLLNLGVKAEWSKKPQNLLSTAIEAGYHDVLAALLGAPQISLIEFKGGSIDLCTPYPQFGCRGSSSYLDLSPLIFACRKDDAESVKLLLARQDLDVNQVVYHDSNEGVGHYTSSAGKRALHLALSVEVLDLLLARPDIDVNAMAQNGLTPLMALAGNPALVKRMLADPRVDPAIVTTTSALHTAIDSMQCESIDSLLADRRVDVNAVEPLAKKTPLHQFALRLERIVDATGAGEKWYPNYENLPCQSQLRAMILNPHTDLGARNAGGKTFLETIRIIRLKESIQRFVNERYGVKNPQPEPKPKPRRSGN